MERTEARRARGFAALVASLLAGALGLSACAQPQTASVARGTIDAAVPEVPAADPPPVDTPIVAPESFEGPVHTAPAPVALSRFRGVTPAGGTWAVMIGIDDYPGARHDLRSAVADATDVDMALGGLGVPPGNRLVLRNAQASADTIKLSADWLVAHAGPDAVAVFFYAGHVRKLAPGTEAIMAADGKYVTDADLAARLRPLQARRAWVAMAACFGGGFTEALAPGRVLTGAAGANQLAYENSALGRSYLVHYMVRLGMIERLAGPTVQEAFDYARAEIARNHPGREPVQVDQVGALLDLKPPGVSAPTRPARSHTPSPPPPPPAAPAPSGGTRSAGGAKTSGNKPPEERDTCERVSLGVVRCQ